MTDREKTSALLSEFKREAQRFYGDRLKGVYLYGSRARGEASQMRM
jgi:predicted nucleotidyltransferase